MTVRRIIPFKNYEINADLMVFDPIKRELEYQLEIMRRNSFPNLPSRLFSTFVIPDNDLYETLWRPKLHLDYGYDLLTLETRETLVWFNAYILDEARPDNLNEVCTKYWESATEIVDTNNQSFLCEAICLKNPIILKVEFIGV